MIKWFKLPASAKDTLDALDVQDVPPGHRAEVAYRRMQRWLRGEPVISAEDATAQHYTADRLKEMNDDFSKEKSDSTICNALEKQEKNKEGQGGCGLAWLFKGLLQGVNNACAL